MEAREVAKVGIVGAGRQGARIAFRCALKGKQVRLYDASQAALERAAELHRELLAARVADGRLTPEQADEVLNRLPACASLEECVAAADLVIEAVPEKLELKRQVFSDLDRLAPAHVLLATNSSSIPSSRIAVVARYPERVFNINFSDPSDDDDLLVELMCGAHTSEATLAAAERFVRSLGMVPIVTRREIMGFSFNRIWRAIKREALHLVDDGYSDFEDIDRAWMMEFRTPFGPFGLMDWIGLDVVRDIERQYYLDSGDERDKPPKILDDLIAAGRLGVKSGRGFYTYPNPAYKDPAWLRKGRTLNRKGAKKGGTTDEHR